MNLNYRAVTAADIDVVCHHREAMFQSTGHGEEVLAKMRPVFREWLQPHLEAGTYLGILAEEADKIVAGVGILLLDWPPHPRHPETTERGYILNVYVEPSHRKMGVAKLMMLMAEDEIRRRGIELGVLHASQAGRPLYEQMGWIATSEMVKPMQAK